MAGNNKSDATVAADALGGSLLQSKATTVFDAQGLGVADSEGSASRSTHRSPWMWATLFAVLVLLTGAMATSTGYQRLADRLDDLEAALNDSTAAQTAAERRVNELSARQDSQIGKLAAVENRLKARPAASKVARQAKPSVFTIRAGEALGSGFVVSNGPRGSLLLTNYHVVADQYTDGNRSVLVTRGGARFDARVVDVSEANDLAVIKVGRDLPALDLTTGRAEVGDPVLVVGSPTGLGGTVTSGIVSSYRKLEAAEYLQFSAPISPGNSGGPVLDGTGRVIGVAVMKIVGEDIEGISYAVPTSRVCEAVDVC